METEVKEFRKIHFQFEIYKEQHLSEEIEGEILLEQKGNQLTGLWMSIMNNLKCNASGLLGKLLHAYQDKQKVNKTN